MTTQSAYVRDAWRFGEGVTLNLGVRSERCHMYMSAQSEPTRRFYFRNEKRQKIGFARAAFQFDLYNATNTNVETGVTTRSGANFGRITGIVPPRIARLGVTFSF